MTIANLIDHLETGVNWNKVFGVSCSTYSDSGFTSRADNFTKSTTIEKALAKFSDLERVDQIGYDFVYGGLKVELKMRQNLFYKRTPHQTQLIKMKNFQGNKKTLQDFKNDQTFDVAIVLCLTTYQCIVIEDDVARDRYFADGDGVSIALVVYCGDCAAGGVDWGRGVWGIYVGTSDVDMARKYHRICLSVIVA